MAWRDDLRPASFRGVPFKVDGHNHGLGRRTELHEYVLKDEPFAEDLGRLPRRYRVEGYVIGPDYMAARDALVDALNAAGPGVLIHPWLGTLTVAVDGEQTVAEDVEQGGQAMFSMVFVEAGVNLAPTITEDTAATSKAAAGGTSTAAVAAMPAGFSVTGMPAFVSTAATGLLGQVQGAIGAAIGGLAPAISQLGGLNQLAADFLGRANSLLATPASMAGELVGLIGQVRSLAGNPLAALPALRSLMGFGGDLKVVLGDTPSRGRQRANQAAIVALVRRAAAAEAVAAVSEIAFSSYDQAAEIRDDLAADIDQLVLEAGDAGDDGAFRSLEDLRTALIRDVNQRGGSLARVFSYQAGDTLPALVIAQRVYGDASRDLEIVERNRIAHPGFVSAGRPLELLAPEGEVA